MKPTATVHDVAAYVLERGGAMSAMKLQKLVYYSQAWSLVWDERAMFPERIEAWMAGPVVPDLYRVHRGEFMVTASPMGDAARLDQAARETVDTVLTYYGDKSAQWLSDLTHLEDPWRKARGGLPDGAWSDAVIPHASMAEYYGSLSAKSAV